MINDPCCYPLGFMYVSSFLKATGHKVKVLNFNLFDYDIKKELKGYDSVCLTGYNQFLDFNINVRNIARELGISTVLGGALATFKTEEMTRIFDNVIVGEVEGNLPIDTIPLPDYDGFGFEEYNRRHEVKYIGVLASRGCPFDCTFCSHLCSYRERDLMKVSEEIGIYKSKYGVDTIVLNDNTANVRKDRFMAICEMMKFHKVQWSAAIRCDIFDEDMAFAAKKSGCSYFVVGVESFIQERLDRMNKRLKVESIYKTLDLLHKYGIDYHGNIILGIDGETVADVADEVTSLPKGYKLFPVVAQEILGTSVKSDIEQEDRDILNCIFAQYANNNGKYVYEGVR
jgi:radical SAM superfamily enzyme YgiQ (UPF0313 family)